MHLERCIICPWAVVVYMVVCFVSSSFLAQGKPPDQLALRTIRERTSVPDAARTHAHVVQMPLVCGCGLCTQRDVKPQWLALCAGRAARWLRGCKFERTGQICTLDPECAASGSSAELSVGPCLLKTHRRLEASLPQAGFPQSGEVWPRAPFEQVSSQ